MVHIQKVENLFLLPWVAFAFVGKQHEDKIDDSIPRGESAKVFKALNHFFLAGILAHYLLSFLYPRVAQGFLWVETSVWINIHQLLDEIDSLWRHILERVLIDDVCLDAATEVTFTKVIIKGEKASKQDVCYNPDGPHIRSLPVRLMILKGLGSGVHQRSHNILYLLVWKASRPKINKFYLQVFIDYYVVQFDVPMTYAPLMAVVNRQQYLSDDHRGLQGGITFHDWQVVHEIVTFANLCYQKEIFLVSEDLN